MIAWPYNPEHINDLVARLLLQYFRHGRSAEVTLPRLTYVEDIRFLRMHWAMSPGIRDLCGYVLAHRHEIQTSLDERERIDDAVIRGRLDARKTVLHRNLVGHPTRVVFREPIKGYSVGPNHVLVWILQHASKIINRIGTSEIAGSSYAAAIEKIRTLLASVAKLEGVSRTLTETNFSVRPSPRALAQSATARRPLYRKAYAAYRQMQLLEQGDESAIVNLLNATLVGPLETWRRFELLLAMAMTSALASHLGAPMQIRSILPNTRGPLFEVGRYSIFWQVRTDAYSEPVPEPSEVLCDNILTNYGIDDGEDRPDVVVVDTQARRVVAIGEAKYFTGETESWRTAFRDATSQLVRYARGYAGGGSVADLVGRSVIGLWYFPSDIRPAAPLPTNTPTAVDFSDMDRHVALNDWAERVTR
jgi:hypothetical protein